MPKTPRKSPRNIFAKLDLTVLKQGSILINSDKVRCRVDRIRDLKAYMTVLDDQTINGEHELVIPTNEVGTLWKFEKSKRRKAS